jgi:glucose-1-phosphate cytidylyltransferase
MLLKKFISIIILVGGSGTRFSKLHEPPKQLQKIKNTYILMHTINRLKKFGFNHFIFPLGYKKSYFEKFFKNKKNVSKFKFNILKNKNFSKDLDKKKINLSLFDAGKKTNKLNRIYKSLKYIQNKYFIVTYGDDIANINYNKLIDNFNKYKKLIVTIFKKKSQYGHVLINFNNHDVLKFIEKPPYQYPINIGNYFFDKDIIVKFKKKNFDLEKNLLPMLAKKKLLSSIEHRGFFYSINDKKELLEARKKLK